ncbi:hypothetical protein CHS0354_023311 [Potamilus streckersoni]|uniref:Metalloendopeptidase n=1 Tax=Potamilus streckersoni TaxID=2493646 RepID=A0AAE0W840_9BIVA|nr:hypothetical protein CHS0354_023311 [Potamilus streckersoni]
MCGINVDGGGGNQSGILNTVRISAAAMVIRAVGFLLLQAFLTFCPCESQLTMGELRQFGIDPLDMNNLEPFTNLTIDQIITQAMGGIGVASNNFLASDGKILAELDMLLTEEQYHSLYETPSDHTPIRGRKKRKAVRDTVLRWTSNEIPYRFVPGDFTEKEQYIIRNAMTEWEKYTCVRFRESKSSDYNVLRFQNGRGCNSQLGMVGGEQALNLDANGCRWKGLYLHEIGHALGLVHEHQLPDRDNFIEILYNNVQPNMRIWFNKYSTQEVNQLTVPYEYSSVMHYGVTAFSSDGKLPTIRAKLPEQEERIGQVWRKELSFSDVKVTNLMYKCAAHCSPTIQCKDDGFLDQNCKCVCADGSDDCEVQGKTPPEEDELCLNIHESWQCYVWAFQGECEKNPRFMHEGCKKACGMCGTKESTKNNNHITTWSWQWICIFSGLCPKEWTIGICQDVYPQDKCQRWEENGDCITNDKWMKEYCRATCKACDNSTTDTEDETTNCNNVHKNETECDKWAKKGECQINTKWMLSNCKKSCHACAQKDKIEKEKEEDTDDNGKEDTGGVCLDKHNTVECNRWAQTGECTVNPNWMLPNCRKSCKKCGGSGVCKNVWDDQQCEGWARDRECIKNPRWMKVNCMKSCGGCKETKDDSGHDEGTEFDKTGNTDTGNTNTSGGGSCVNNHKSEKDCNTWAKYGHCDINPWMKKHCAKSCGECSGEEDTTETESTSTGSTNTGNKDKSTGCADTDKNCIQWAKHGYCKNHSYLALSTCRKSCGTCDPNTECSDKHSLCSVWQRGEQCRRNPGYMMRFCSKSCGAC